jgi:hypothetical protein
MFERSPEISHVLAAFAGAALVAGCARSDATPPAPSPAPSFATPAAAPPLDAGARSAPPPPPDPNAGFPSGVRAVHAFPDGTRVGLVAREKGSDAVFARSPGSGAATLAEVLDGKVVRDAWIDLDADGVEEWIVWTDDAPSVLALREGKVVALVRRQWLLEDMKDEAAVRASLSRLRRYAAPADAATPREVLLTLQLASDAELRALMDPKGVSVCVEKTGNARPHGRSCHTVRAGDWSATRIFDELLRERAFADYWTQPFAVRDHTDGSWASQPPTCTTKGDTTHCKASMGGPGDYVWEFRGQGASLRLHALSTVFYEST